MFLRRRNHELALIWIVAAGFLDINMLAGGAGQDGCGGMPMVGSRDRDGIEVLAFEHLPHVLYPFWLARLFLRYGGDASLDGAAVHVTNVRDFGICFGKVTSDVSHTAPIAADDPDQHFFIRAFCCVDSRGGSEGWDSGNCDRSVFQKIAPRHNMGERSNPQIREETAYRIHNLHEFRVRFLEALDGGAQAAHGMAQ